MPTLDVDGSTVAGLGLAAAGTGLSIAADMEEGKDVGQSVKEHAVDTVKFTAMVGVPLYFASTGTGAVAGVAQAGLSLAGSPWLALGALAYGGYRYASAVAARPEREAEANLAQQREVNAGLAGQSLPDLEALVAREMGELQSLQKRYDASAAAVTANAAGIRERATRIQGLLAAMRAALQPKSEPAGPAPKFKEWEDALAAKVREANSLADACASEADAARALAAYNEAVGRASYIISQADAARAAKTPAATDVSGLRDSIVSDAGAIAAMQSRLEANWGYLPAIKSQFDSRRLTLIGRIQGVRSALPPTIPPDQKALFDRLSATAQAARLSERATDLSESPEATQKLAGAAVQAKLDAQDLAARAEAAASAESPSTALETAEASASSSIFLLASAEGVPAKAQACHDRLASAAGGFISLGGENKSNNDDTKPQQKETVVQPAESVNLLNVTPNQAQPETELLTRNSIRQAMESAGVQADRLKQEQKDAYEREMQQLQQPQQPGAEQTRRPGFLEVLTTMVQGYNTLQTGMNSPAGFQNPRVGQYYANMMDRFREQNGGKGPSSDQLTSLLNTVQRLRSQVGGGQSANALRPEDWLKPIAPGIGQQGQAGQQLSPYEQQVRLLAQGLGARPAQPAVPSQPQSPQPQAQPQQPKPQVQPVKTVAPTPQKPAQPAAPPKLSCSQQFCQQCIAGKMGTGEYASMSCQTCEWALRPQIVPCERRLAAGTPLAEMYLGAEMSLICASPRDPKTGKCSTIKMEWSDLRPPRDPDWYYACGTSAIGCKSLIDKIKRLGYADLDTRMWEGVKFIMPQGW